MISHKRALSIRLLKLCETSVSKPLYILFNNSVMNECSPKECKKANIGKKSWWKIMKNCRPMSLLSIFRKKFEKITFDFVFKYLEDKKLLIWNHSGFRPGDSCVHQLLSIIEETYKLFDANPSLEVRRIFWTYLKSLTEFSKMAFFINVTLW